MAAGIPQALEGQGSMQSTASVVLPAETSVASDTPAAIVTASPEPASQTSSGAGIDIPVSAPSLPPQVTPLSAGLPPPSLTVVPVHRRRRSSKLTMPAIIKRSASTPNVRGQAAAEAAALSLAADKRRNKLGYHRTSVACGHCRRRKIRCLLAPEDPTGRCLNCIRLKKECNFFPVDQQPPTGPGSRAGSKTDRSSTNNSSSASPSPPLPSGPVHDHASVFNQYAAIPLPSAPAEYGMPADGRAPNGVAVSLGAQASRLHSAARAQRPHLAHMETAPTSRSFDFSADSRRTSTWDGSPYEQSPVSGEPRSAIDDPSTNFWRLAESPITPAFSYGGPSPVTPMPQRDGFSFGGAREDLAWPLPSSRSMSVGHFDGYPRDYANQYGVPADYKQTTPTSIYPPSLNTSNLSMSTISEPPSAVTEASAAPMSSAFGAQTGWNPSFVANAMGSMPSKGTDGFGGWYAEPGHLAQVEEEAPGFPFTEESPIIYQQPAQSAV